ncbi:MAG: glycosyltransferase family 9 protein [Chloroflexaceae bacterium]|nr:glycosyltransferase family 9 protein [Chloroflexaceae bacterium]
MEFSRFDDLWGARNSVSVWQQVRNLLVMRLDNIGDVIMTTPALRSLREALPQAKITLMTSPGGSLVVPLLPWIDEAIAWQVLWQDLGNLAFDPQREWDLIAALSARDFDGAIIFTSFSQSPHPAALVGNLAGIPLRLGESKENGLGILTHPVAPAPDDLHQVDRNLRLIEAVGFPVRDRNLALAIPAVSPVSGSYIVLNPWTSCQSRNYDVMRFAVAANQLSQITGWPVAVTGVAKDRARSQSLLAYLENPRDLLGKTSLAELVALIARAKLLLSNNTSTMHIADATKTPSVILFAGTELECQWRPRSAPAKLLRRPTPCSPCYAFACPYNLECLEIAPEEVVAAGLELLDLNRDNPILA